MIETGDFHVNTVGDNLPNENEIREKYGSKSFLLLGSSRAISEASGTRAIEEFAASPEEIAIAKKYGDEATALLTAMHETLGHGSGKLNPEAHAGAHVLPEGIFFDPRGSPRRPHRDVGRMGPQDSKNSG